MREGRNKVHAGDRHRNPAAWWMLLKLTALAGGEILDEKSFQAAWRRIH